MVEREYALVRSAKEEYRMAQALDLCVGGFYTLSRDSTVTFGGVIMPCEEMGERDFQNFRDVNFEFQRYREEDRLRHQFMGRLIHRIPIINGFLGEEKENVARKVEPDELHVISLQSIHFMATSYQELLDNRYFSVKEDETNPDLLRILKDFFKRD